MLRGEQRYICKDCNFCFIETTNLNKTHKDSKPLEVRQLANTLYLKGSSFRDIKEIIEDTFSTITVSITTIIKWTKKRG